MNTYLCMWSALMFALGYGLASHGAIYSASVAIFIGWVVFAFVLSVSFCGGEKNNG